jgi:Xaa-Pro dipeptidase
LTHEGCRARQERLFSRLDEAGIPAALITAPRDIYYLTGLLPEGLAYPYPSALFLGPGLKSWLVTGKEGGQALVDERLVYPITLMGTLNPDCHERLCSRVAGPAARTQNLPRLGCQRESLPHSVAHVVSAAASPREWVEVDGILQDLQLRKDADELACLRRAVAANLAGYDRAQELLRPVITEMEMVTECQAAAQRYTRSVHFYNGDFQSGEFGGFARGNRPIQAGELYIIDAWSDVDGYWCDMSRTWSVGGEPTDLQAGIYEHVAAVLRAVPSLVRPGLDTREFWRELDARLREHPRLADTGLVHHGGHGVGVRVHEGPDLNRDRGGVFEVGNVFTCEPAAYLEDLRAGVRLENVFHLGEDGVEVLSDYPLSIIAGGR